MSNIRKAVMEAVFAADRLHRDFDSKSAADREGGRIDVFGMFAGRRLPLMFRPLRGLLGAFIDGGAPGAMVTTQRQLPVQRFTAAHELGHAVLGHKPSIDDEEVLRRTPFGTSARYDLQEVQANAFACELLMPQWLLAKHVSRQGWAPADLCRPEVVYQLSLRLGTSYAATCHALSRYKAVGPAAYSRLLETEPKAIKQRLAEPYEPANWYGDVWLLSERDDGILLEGSRSDLVVLTFLEHSGSGYVWRLDDLAEAGLIVVDDSRISPDGAGEMVGGILRRRVIAEARNGARGAFTLAEVRPWQRTGEPLQSLAVDIDLSGPVAGGLLPAERRAWLGAA
ncbi:MAG TPA: ImmA/IrrE family metallo-endopeptidase [Pirellulales bacterium]|nr:ImmA/IrrE family metallo-endopeptidase [Pirellulales bacterium]